MVHIALYTCCVISMTVKVGLIVCSELDLTCFMSRAIKRRQLQSGELTAVTRYTIPHSPFFNVKFQLDRFEYSNLPKLLFSEMCRKLLIS